MTKQRLPAHFLIIGLVLAVALFGWVAFAQLQAFNQPLVAVVAPLPGDTVHGSVVVLVQPDNPEKIVRTVVRLQSSDDPPVVLAEKELSAAGNWSAEFDSKTVPDGAYRLEVESCLSSGCGKKTIEITVQNAPVGFQSAVPGNASAPVAGPAPTPLAQSASTPAPIPVLPVRAADESGHHQLVPANVLSVLYVIDPVLPEKKFVSSGDPVDVPDGQYAVRLELFDSPVKEIVFSAVDVRQNATVAVLADNFMQNDFQVGNDLFEPVYSTRVLLGLKGLRNVFSVFEKPGLRFFYCMGDLSFGQGCPTGWKTMIAEKGLVTLEVSDSPVLLVWARPKAVGKQVSRLPFAPNKEGQTGVVWVLPSNVSARATVQPDAWLAATVSFEGQTRLAAGRYDVALDFNGMPFSQLSLKGLQIDANGLLAKTRTLDAAAAGPMPDAQQEWVSVFEVWSDFSFAQATLQVPLLSQETLLRCSDWVLQAVHCTSWEPLDAANAPVLAGFNVFAVQKRKRVVVNPSNAPAFAILSDRAGTVLAKGENALPVGVGTMDASIDFSNQSLARVVFDGLLVDHAGFLVEEKMLDPARFAAPADSSLDWLSVVQLKTGFVFSQASAFFSVPPGGQLVQCMRWDENREACNGWQPVLEAHLSVVPVVFGVWRPKTILITPSTVSALLHLSKPQPRADSQMVAYSFSQESVITPGLYDAQLDMNHSVVASASFQRLLLDHNGVVFRVNQFSLEDVRLPKGDWSHWIAIIGIRSDFGFSAGSFKPALQEPMVVYRCTQWHDPSNRCLGSWEASPDLNLGPGENVFGLLPVEPDNALDKNAEKNPHEPKQPTSMVVPSNVFARLELADLAGKQVADTQEPVQIPMGAYAATLHFSNGPVQTVFLKHVLLNHDGTLVRFHALDWDIVLAVRRFVDGLLNKKESFNPLFDITVDYNFGSGQAVPTDWNVLKNLFVCPQWSYEANKCLLPWEKAFDLSLHSGSNVFGVPSQAAVLDENIEIDPDMQAELELLAQGIVDLRNFHPNKRFFVANNSRNRLSTLQTVFDSIELGVQCDPSKGPQQTVDSFKKSGKPTPVVRRLLDTNAMPTAKQPVAPFVSEPVPTLRDVNSVSSDANQNPLPQSQTTDDNISLKHSVSTMVANPFSRAFFSEEPKPLAAEETSEQLSDAIVPRGPVPSVLVPIADDANFGSSDFNADSNAHRYKSLDQLKAEYADGFFSNRWEDALLLPQDAAQSEDRLNCDGVQVVNSFRSTAVSPPTKNEVWLGGSQHSVKQSMQLTNDTNQSQTRLVGIRLLTPVSLLVGDTRNFVPSTQYQRVPTKKQHVVIETGSDSEPMGYDMVTDAMLRFRTETYELGRYDWSDFVTAGFPTTTLVHKKNGEAVVETLVQITLAPYASVSIDPAYDLNSSTSFQIRWHGGVNSDRITDTNSSDAGMQLVNVDGNAYANDLLIASRFADVNGKGDSGVIYLIKDIDKKDPASFDLNSISNFDARWNGGTAVDVITSETGPNTIQIVNIDNNAYANDLIFGAPRADVNNKTDAGAIYLIKDVDKKSGSYDLRPTQNFSAAWNGSRHSDKIGYTGNRGWQQNSIDQPGFQIINADGNAYSNDLLIECAFCEADQNDMGAVYLIQDIDKKNGMNDLNSFGNFTVRWTGGAKGDTLGFTNFSGNGVQWVNLDNNAAANDLVITAPSADTNTGRPNNGAVYVILDANQKTGELDLNTPTSYTASYIGAASSDLIGDTNLSGQGVMVVNIDNNSYANDLLITAAFGDTGPTSNTGNVFLIKDVDKKTLNAQYDLNVSANYAVLWRGAAANDELGTTLTSGPPVQLVNIDNNSYPNDLIFTVPLADVNGKTNNGAIYVYRDVDKNSGTNDLDGGGGLMFNGGHNQAFLGRNHRGGSAVQLVNSDGNTFANDLLIAAPDENGYLQGSGTVFLLRDINLLSGAKDLNGSDNFALRFDGATVNDRLGFVSSDYNAVQLVDAQGDGRTNDLLIVSALADVDGNKDAGLVYFIKNIDLNSGIFDLNNAHGGNGGVPVYSARWKSGSLNDRLGFVGTAGAAGQRGLQFGNFDGGPYANDLLIAGSDVDVNNNTDAGAVYLIRSIDRKSGDLNMAYSDMYDTRWSGGMASNKLGHTNGSSGISVVNVDNNSYANDLLLANAAGDLNGKTNSGAVYLIKDFAITNMAPDVNIISPSSRTVFGVNDGNLGIDFNLQNDNNYLLADFYYSSTASTFQSLIVQDLNLYKILQNPTVDVNCTNTNGAGFLARQTCHYDWNIQGLPTQKIFIDINVSDGEDLNKASSTSAKIKINNWLTSSDYNALGFNNKHSLVRTPDGNLWMVYFDAVDRNAQVFVTMSDDNGLTWKTPIPLMDRNFQTAVANNLFNPAVAVDSNAALHVVWADSNGTQNDIHYRFCFSAQNNCRLSASWSADLNLSADNNNSNYPAIVISSDNNVNVVWANLVTNNTLSYFVRCESPGNCDNNANWSARVPLIPGGVSADINYWYPGISVKPNNTFGVITQFFKNSDANARIEYQQCTASCNIAANWSSALAISTVGNSPPFASFSFDTNNSAVVAFTTNAGLGRVLSCGGTCTASSNWDFRDFFGSSSTGTVSLAVDPDKNTQFVWALPSGTYDINGARRQFSTGGTLSTTIQKVSNGTVPSYMVSTRHDTNWDSSASRLDYCWAKGSAADYNLACQSDSVPFNLYIPKCGAITATQTWLSGNTYLVSCDVNVSGTGVDLNIQAGAMIKFSPGTSLWAEGNARINANGTADSNIVFTSCKDQNTYLGSTNADTSTVSGCSGAPTSGDYNTAIWIRSSAGMAKTDTFSYLKIFDANAGIRLDQNLGSVHDSSFMFELLKGIQVTVVSSDLNVYNNSFANFVKTTGAPTGVQTPGHSLVQIYRNLFDNFSGAGTYGISEGGSASQSDLGSDYNNTFSNFSTSAAGIDLTDSNANIYNNAFTKISASAQAIAVDASTNFGGLIHDNNFSDINSTQSIILITTTGIFSGSVYNNLFDRTAAGGVIIGTGSGAFSFIGNIYNNRFTNLGSAAVGIKMGGAWSGKILNNTFANIPADTNAIHNIGTYSGSIQRNLFANALGVALKDVNSAATVSNNGHFNVGTVSTVANQTINDINSQTGLTTDPFIADGSDRNFLLNTTSTGGATLVDAGGVLSSGVDINNFFNRRVTQASNLYDWGTVDIGYHYDSNGNARPALAIINPASRIIIGVNDGNTSIDFNVLDDSNYLNADLYYSATRGKFTNLIVQDLNLYYLLQNPTVDVNCTNTNGAGFLGRQTCHYDWNVLGLATQRVYIDANLADTSDVNAIASSFTKIKIHNKLTASATTGLGTSARFNMVRTSDGNLWLVYFDTIDGNAQPVITQSDDNGFTWKTPLPLMDRNTAVSTISMDPAIDVNSSNGLHVVWVDSNRTQNDIHYRNCPATRNCLDISNWSTDYNLSNDQNNSSQVAIAVSKDDNVHVAWTETIAGITVDYTQCSTQPCTSASNWSSVIRLTRTGAIGSTSATTSIGVNSANKVGIAQADANGITTFALDYFECTGSCKAAANWSGSVPVMLDLNSALRAAFAFDKNNTAVLIAVAGSPARLKVKSCSTGCTTIANWSDTNISPPADNSKPPSLSTGNDNNTYFLWFDSAGINDINSVRRQGSDGTLTTNGIRFLAANPSGTDISTRKDANWGSGFQRLDYCWLKAAGADNNVQCLSDFLTNGNVGIVTPGADYSFVLLLPSSGCTNGKGRLDSGSGACQKGYFETTDLSGVADENKVDPEGQTSSIPFFVYDNQSTSSADLNILLDLNQSLPASLLLKVSKIYAGWAFSCTGNTDTNCLLVSTTATNIGKATYSAGTQDLNIFVWGDFNAAGVGSTDRNVDSNSVSP